jgi:hypothetical protein
MSSVFNKYLVKTIRGLENVSGKKANDWKNRANVLREAEAKGTTAAEAEHKAKFHSAETLHARVKLGLGAGATVGAGFLGAHKYRQHQDNEIMKRIDKLYNRS